MAARGAAGVFRSASASRIDGRARPGDGRSEDERRNGPREGRRSRLHDRIWTAWRWRVVPRNPEDDVGTGESGCVVREKEPHHVAHDRCGFRPAARRHHGREDSVGHRRDQSAGGAHGRDHPDGARGREADRYGGRAGRRGSLRRGWGREHSGADSGALGVQAGTGQNECGAGKDHERGGSREARASRSGAMTNTLHRYGDAASFFDDFIVFAIPSRGKNDQGSVPKLKKFLEMALPFKPVNLGDAIHGGALRPSRNMQPTAHWKRDMTPDFRAVIDGVDAPTTVAAVFDDRVSAEDFLKTVRAADLGLCINISTSIDGAEQCCHAAGIPRHSVGYSLGFQGKTEKLPNSQVLALTTMCGHGMISTSLAKKMIDWVKEGRRSPEQAVTYMARFCSCGVYNPSRAKRILEDARTKIK